MQPSKPEKIAFPSEVRTVAFAGDWHGNGGWAREMIRQLPGQVEVVLHLGDFGYNFDEGYLNSVNRVAREADIIVMFIDGNHENFNMLYNDWSLEPEGYRKLRPRVWHLPRNFRWEWSGLKFMAMGGAHSVDRPARTPFLEWWPNETITHAEFYEAISSGPVDVMLTHDAPAGHTIPGLMPDGFFPADEIRYADQHRGVLREIVNATGPKYLWHGHYHSFYRAETDYGLMVTGLHCDGTTFEENIEVVDLKELKQLVIKGA